MMSRMFLDATKWHDDIRLMRRARVNRWPICEDFTEEMVGRLRVIVNSTDDKLALEAITEARHMMAQNQKDEHHKAVLALEQLNNQLANYIGPTANIAHSDATGGAEATSFNQPEE